MGEFLASLIPWGTDAILWVQSFRHPFFDVLFQAATFLGEEEFYLIFLPFIYWCLNKQVGVGLIYISIFSTYLNSVVKLTFRLPRPSDPRLVLLRTETSPSFPSNHAQGAVVNWGYLATQFRHKVFSIVAVALILLIAFSRIYVGVHFPQDVVGGLLIGLLLLVAYNWLVGTIEKRRFDLPLPIELILSVVVPLALLFAHPFDVDGTYPAELAATTMGAFLGMSTGFVLEQEYIRFKADGLWWKRGSGSSWAWSWSLSSMWGSKLCSQRKCPIPSPSLCGWSATAWLVSPRPSWPRGSLSSPRWPSEKGQKSPRATLPRVEISRAYSKSHSAPAGR